MSTAATSTTSNTDIGKKRRAEDDGSDPKAKKAKVVGKSLCVLNDNTLTDIILFCPSLATIHRLAATCKTLRGFTTFLLENDLFTFQVGDAVVSIPSGETIWRSLRIPRWVRSLSLIAVQITVDTIEQLPKLTHLKLYGCSPSPTTRAQKACKSDRCAVQVQDTLPPCEEGCDWMCLETRNNDELELSLETFPMLENLTARAISFYIRCPLRHFKSMEFDVWSLQLLVAKTHDMTCFIEHEEMDDQEWADYQADHTIYAETLRVAADLEGAGKLPVAMSRSAKQRSGMSQFRTDCVLVDADTADQSHSIFMELMRILGDPHQSNAPRWTMRNIFCDVISNGWTHWMDLLLQKCVELHGTGPNTVFFHMIGEVAHPQSATFNVTNGVRANMPMLVRGRDWVSARVAFDTFLSSEWDTAALVQEYQGRVWGYRGLDGDDDEEDEEDFDRDAPAEINLDVNVFTVFDFESGCVNADDIIDNSPYPCPSTLAFLALHPPPRPFLPEELSYTIPAPSEETTEIEEVD
jgi:hypothetical protein